MAKLKNNNAGKGHILTVLLQDYFHRGVFKQVIGEKQWHRFESRLETSLTAIFDTDSKSNILWPRIAYIFQNGFSIELSYANITGIKPGKSNDNFFQPLFYYYEENDVVIGRIRYEY